MSANLMSLARSGGKFLKLFGDRKMMKPLPYDTEVEWLEGDGRSYIKTSITSKKNMAVLIKAMVIDTKEKSFVCGAFSTYIGTLDGVFSVVNDYSHGAYVDIDDIAEGDIIETSLIGDLIAVSKNGSNIATIGRIYYNERCVFYIFSASDTDSISNNPFGIAKSRIYSFAIVNEMNEYVADFIPVRKDGVGYMYDRVSGKLFGNAGTGGFIVGPDKTI